MSELDTFYACVVDGEFTGVIAINEGMFPALVAGMKSNPTIVPVSKEKGFSLQLGMIWDGTEFKLAEE